MRLYQGSIMAERPDDEKLITAKQVVIIVVIVAIVLAVALAAVTVSPPQTNTFSNPINLL